MKTNKFFAAALAALALVGFTACGKQNTPENLELSESALQLKVGETHQLTANVTVESWTSSNEQVATVKDGLVTALAEGNAIISATANGQTKTCVVAVKKDSDGQGGDATITAKRIWAVLLDGVTAEANASIMAGDFRVDDVENHLYIWASGETYAANENATGKNYFGNNEGYTALTVVAPAGWSGLGFCIERAESITAMQALKEAIVANPDNFYLHIGLKSATAGNHIFYFFGNESTKLTIGSGHMTTGDGEDPTPVYGDFERDGAWHGFDIPMANYASAIAAAEVKAGINIFCALSGNAAGAQLNLDAIYFYEK
ncbi:MAG: Ig-like domain-containing protein [Paludibacteraceae bacterium]|nr:Ig-like domain-containing protein [Paludibacteraceae bacterium]